MPRTSHDSDVSKRLNERSRPTSKDGRMGKEADILLPSSHKSGGGRERYSHLQGGEQLPHFCRQQKILTPGGIRNLQTERQRGTRVQTLIKL